MINCLSSDIIKLLSSAQLIVNIESVIKELLENAIDALATSIEILLDDYGLQRIEFKDNGVGINEEDIKHTVKHYFTSKIIDHQDLVHLKTYGFRGEALYSINTVGNLNIATKCANEDIGHKYYFDEHGIVFKQQPYTMNTGTIIVVKSIFHNMPVRKQHLNVASKKKLCLQNIIKICQDYNLAHPNLNIILKNDHSLIYQKTPSSDLLKSVLNLYPFISSDNYHNFIYDGIQIEAILPQLGFHGIAHHKYVFKTIVNKRPVSLKFFEKEFRLMYENTVKSNSQIYLESPNQPNTIKGINSSLIVIVSISMPTHLCDINLEPDKSRILFSNKDEMVKIFKNLFHSFYGSDVVNSSKQVISNNNAFNNSCKNQDISKTSNGLLDSDKSKDRMIDWSEGRYGPRSPTAITKSHAMKNDDRIIAKQIDRGIANANSYIEYNHKISNPTVTLPSVNSSLLEPNNLTLTNDTYGLNFYQEPQSSHSASDFSFQPLTLEPKESIFTDSGRNTWHTGNLVYDNFDGPPVSRNTFYQNGRDSFQNFGFPDTSPSHVTCKLPTQFEIPIVTDGRRGDDSVTPDPTSNDPNLSLDLDLDRSIDRYLTNHITRPVQGPNHGYPVWDEPEAYRELTLERAELRKRSRSPESSFEARVRGRAKTLTRLDHPKRPKNITEGSIYGTRPTRDIMKYFPENTEGLTKSLGRSIVMVSLPDDIEGECDLDDAVRKITKPLQDGPITKYLNFESTPKNDCTAKSLAQYYDQNYECLDLGHEECGIPWTLCDDKGLEKCQRGSPPNNHVQNFGFVGKIGSCGSQQLMIYSTRGNHGDKSCIRVISCDIYHDLVSQNTNPKPHMGLKTPVVIESGSAIYELLRDEEARKATFNPGSGFDSDHVLHYPYLIENGFYVRKELSSVDEDPRFSILNVPGFRNIPLDNYVEALVTILEDKFLLGMDDSCISSKFSKMFHRSSLLRHSHEIYSWTN